MPTVEKVSGGLVYIRPLERRFEIGDRADVDDELAAYLTEERGDFAIVDEDDSEPDESDEDDICGEEMSDGSTCDRPADECPYHGDDEDEEP